MNDNDPEFAEDLLRGARAIAMFLDGRSDDKARRSVYHLVQTTNFPSFKIGSTICARRSRVLAWVRAQEERHAEVRKKA
jgi:hypothetical protein